MLLPLSGIPTSPLVKPYSLLEPQLSDPSPSQHTPLSFLCPEPSTQSPSQGYSLQPPTMRISATFSNDKIPESKIYFLFISPKPLMVPDTSSVLNKYLLWNKL